MNNPDPKAEAIEAINRVAAECAAPGWDGERADPVSQATVDRAARFVRALPDGVPLPEFAAAPDGSLCLDWIRTRNRMLSISVDETGAVPCAWLDGATSGHVVSRVDGESIPADLLDRIRGGVKDG